MSRHTGDVSVNSPVSKCKFSTFINTTMSLLNCPKTLHSYPQGLMRNTRFYT